MDQILVAVEEVALSDSGVLAMDTEVYISGDVYMESILVYYFHCVLTYLLWEWAAMNLLAGTLTTNA